MTGWRVFRQVLCGTSRGRVRFAPFSSLRFQSFEFMLGFLNIAHYQRKDILLKIAIVYVVCGRLNLTTHDFFRQIFYRYSLSEGQQSLALRLLGELGPDDAGPIIVFIVWSEHDILPIKARMYQSPQDAEDFLLELAKVLQSIKPDWIREVLEFEATPDNAFITETWKRFIAEVPPQKQ